MRLFALLSLGLAVGCGSTPQRADGGGGGNGGRGGEGGAGGAARAGGDCLFDGQLHPNGMDFQCGCSLCNCRNGVVGFYIGGTCPRTCEMDTTYRYGDTGGLVPFEDTSTLAPTLSYTRARTSFVPDGGSDASCAPPLPACDSGVGFDVERIMRAIADDDVQVALAMTTPPLFGADTRPVDGTVFQFLRADGRGFLVGVPCAAGSSGCENAPIGVAVLVATLRALDTQQLMDPTCAALR